MVRILHIVGSVEKGGIQTFLMNIYRGIDRSKIQFDFAIYEQPKEGDYKDEIESMGGKIYLLPKKKDGLIKCHKAIVKIIRDNRYDVVWKNCLNCFSALDLIAAKHGGASERILHAHGSDFSGIARYLHFMVRPIVNMYSTKRIACGIAAGMWMFGKRYFELMHNGINIELFRPDLEMRDQIRDEYGLREKTVILNVARFERVKNQHFLIRVFDKYIKINPNARLVLIGYGELENKCRELVKELGLSDTVLFLGRRNNIFELIKMADIYAMPSLYEGFPVSLVEAQVAGLPCVVSDTIPAETNIYGGVRFLGIQEEDEERWCNIFEEIKNKRYEDGWELMVKEGFDTKNNIEFVTKMFV